MLKANEMKDESNQRILKALVELNKVMEEEGRGFIFVPIVQTEGDHKTMAAVAFNTKRGEMTDDEMHRFWATLAALVENFQHQLPEDLLPAYKEGFMVFIKMVIDRCFPSIKIIKD